MPLMEPYSSCWSVTDDRPTKFCLMICSAWSYRLDALLEPLGLAALHAWAAVAAAEAAAGEAAADAVFWACGAQVVEPGNA